MVFLWGVSIYTPAEAGGFAFVIQILSHAKKNVFIFAFLCFRC